MDWFKQILAILRAHGIRCRIGRMWRGEREEVFLALEGVRLEDLTSPPAPLRDREGSQENGNE